MPDNTLRQLDKPLLCAMQLGEPTDTHPNHKGQTIVKSHLFSASSLTLKGTRTYTLCGIKITSMEGRTGPLTPQQTLNTTFPHSCPYCTQALEHTLEEFFVPPTWYAAWGSKERNMVQTAINASAKMPKI